MSESADSATQQEVPQGTSIESADSATPQEVPQGTSIVSVDSATPQDVPQGTSIESVDSDTPQDVPQGTSIESADSATPQNVPQGISIVSADSATPQDVPQGTPNPSERRHPNRNFFTGPKKDYLEKGVPLYKASIKYDWKAAKGILDANPEYVTYSITENDETALHIAASAKGPKKVNEFVRNLVGKMQTEDLALVNRNNYTALYLAAAAGNVETVKIMLDKNKALLTGAEETMPLYTAALFGNDKVVQYLYEKSPELPSADGWTDRNRSWLLEKCVESDMFDTALKIVKPIENEDNGRRSNEGIGRRSNVLGILARKPEAFRKKESNIIGRTIKS
ncbi:ankyrin repeat-containing domain, PGG domain protein, partial [Tanacetum coccineum]